MSTVGGESPNALLARVIHLARFMLATSPEYWRILDAELNVPPGPAMSRYVLATGTPENRVYVVADNGTYTTQTSLPEWAMDPDVQILEDALPPADDSIALEYLSEAADALKSTDKSLYDALNIGGTVELVTSYYGSPELGSLVQVPSQQPSIGIAQLDEVLSDVNTARSWAEEALDRIVLQLMLLQASIEANCQAIAALAIIMSFVEPRVPLIGGLLYILAPGIDPEEITAIPLAEQIKQVKQSAAEFPFASANITPLLEPAFYATYLELAHQRGVGISFKVATSLEEHADGVLISTRSCSSMEVFYSHLVEALAYYRAAASIYGFIVDLHGSDEAALKYFPTLNEHRVICEERRVTLLSSLELPTRNTEDHFNPTSPTSIDRWITDFAARPLADVEADIRDWSLRLIIPPYMRDLIMGSVYRLAGRPRAAQRSLTRAYEVLDRDEGARNPFRLIDLNLLPPLSRELAAVYDMLDDSETATRLRTDL